MARLRTPEYNVLSARRVTCRSSTRYDLSAMSKTSADSIRLKWVTEHIAPSSRERTRSNL